MGIESLFKRAGEVIDKVEGGVRQGERVLRQAAPVVGRVKGLIGEAERMFRPGFSQELREAAELLGLALPTDADAIESAYKRAALRTHPDHGGTNAQFMRVQAARDLLKVSFPRFP